MMYNYKEAIKHDVKDWMQDNHTPGMSMEEEMTFDYVYECCWVDDSVTGNGSGSYTFSRWEARKNFFEDDNSEDYISEMITEGLVTREEVGRHMADSDWEWMDVCIRCHLLYWAVDEAIKEIDF